MKQLNLPMKIQSSRFSQLLDYWIQIKQSHPNFKWLMNVRTPQLISSDPQKQQESLNLLRKATLIHKILIIN